jgi:Cytochrome C and Quinol oxidase polypeptide I
VARMWRFEPEEVTVPAGSRSRECSSGPSAIRLSIFWLLPTCVMYYTMLPKLCGGKLFSDFAGRLTFLWLLVYSAPVGIHHQFTEPGISDTWKFVHLSLPCWWRSRVFSPPSPWPHLWSTAQCRTAGAVFWAGGRNCPISIKIADCFRIFFPGWSFSSLAGSPESSMRPTV